MKAIYSGRRVTHSGVESSRFISDLHPAKRCLSKAAFSAANVCMWFFCANASSLAENFSIRRVITGFEFGLELAHE